MQLVNNTLVTDANRVVIKYCTMPAEEFERLNEELLHGYSYKIKSVLDRRAFSQHLVIDLDNFAHSGALYQELINDGVTFDEGKRECKVA